MANITFDDYLKQKLTNPEFKNDYELESLNLKIALTVVTVRKNAGLTQRELAQLAAVPQSTVARIERGDNTSFDTSAKIAAALGKKLEITFV